VPGHDLAGVERDGRDLGRRDPQLAAARELAIRSAVAQGLPALVADPAALAAAAVILARAVTRSRPAAGSVSAVRR
jgi:hypothetical protein